MNTLYTIGHSNHDAVLFISLLAAHGIETIVDVRSSPYSKYVPHFSKDNVQRILRDANVDYLFLGRELGARREEEQCYAGGQAKYALVAQLPRFREGLERVLTEVASRPVALMCSEADPLDCHRTILVCRELLRVRPDLAIVHVLPDGGTETQPAAVDRLIALHKIEPELFGDLNSAQGMAERAYDLQAERVAYTRAETEP